MELISNKNPDRRNAGMKAVVIAICEARNWFFVTAEMSSPCPSTGIRNVAESA
jgi:hypothetical protein